jgi:antitoxin HicB
MMETIYKIPLIFEPQPEGGYTVTSPLLPELVTEGDTLEEVMENVKDALRAVLELYEDMGRPIPPILQQAPDETRFLLESAVAL